MVESVINIDVFFTYINGLSLRFIQLMFNVYYFNG